MKTTGNGEQAPQMSWRRLASVSRRAVAYLRPQWPHLAAMFVCFSLLGVILVPIGLLLADVLWTRVLLGAPLTEDQARTLDLPADPFVTASELSSPERHRVLDRWLVFFGLAAALGLPAGLALFGYRLWVLQRINQTLRLDLLDQLQGLSLRFHREHAGGDAIYRMMQDAAMVSRFLEALVLTPIGALAQLLFAVGVVSLFDPRLSGLLLATLIPLAGLAWFRTAKLRRELRTARAASARVTTRVQEVVAALPVVKACGSEDWDLERFARESRRSFAAAHRARSHVASYEVQVFWVLGTALVLGTVAAAANVRADAPTAAALLGIQVWTLGLWTYFRSRFADGSGQARTLFVNWGRAQDVFAGLGRVFDLLEQEPEVRDAPDAVDLPIPRRGVRAHRVTFRYDGDGPALDGVDFEAPVGTITAIVGPSGAGKSTLLSLLLRLDDPDSGSIEIDGVPLSQVRRASLRARVSIALQEPLLFGGSIADNIRFAEPEASDRQVEAAARVACADDFIRALPRGYATELGERGVKLSTGQRQRLSIARAVLKDPAILLLDEPTAAVDADTEERLVASLAEWGRERTLFVVTHRPTTAAMADRVLALDHGRVVDPGQTA